MLKNSTYLYRMGYPSLLTDNFRKHVAFFHQFNFYFDFLFIAQ